MYFKASMRPIDKRSLSEHEVKRCRAVARGQHWEVWEESILWWSPDKVRWQPLEEDILPSQRRWLTVEREEGFQVALIWQVGDAFTLPLTSEQSETAPERERI